MTTEFNGFKKD